MMIAFILMGLWLLSVFGVLYFASKAREKDFKRNIAPTNLTEINGTEEKEFLQLPDQKFREERPKQASWLSVFDENHLSDQEFLAELAEQQAKLKHFYLCKIILDRISDKQLRARVFITLAFEMANKKHLFSAHQIVTAVSDEECREEVLAKKVKLYCNMAEICLEFQEPTLAETMLQDALPTLEKLPDSLSFKAELIQQMAELQKRLQKFENQEFLVTLAQQQAKARNCYLCKIILDRIEDKHKKAQILVTLAQEMAEAGNLLDAELIAQSVVDEDCTQAVWSQKAGLYCDMAEKCLDGHELGWAQNMIQDALKLIAKLDESLLVKADLLRRIGGFKIMLKQSAEGLETWKKAVALAKELHKKGDLPTKKECEALVRWIANQLIQLKILGSDKRIQIFKLTLDSQVEAIVNYPGVNAGA